MDSHETHLTGDEDIIITKSIRSVSGKNVGWHGCTNANIQVLLSYLVSSVFHRILVGHLTVVE